MSDRRRRSGAAGASWHDHVVVIGGEVRSSTRTPAVLAWPLSKLGQTTISNAR